MNKLFGLGIAMFMAFSLGGCITNMARSAVDVSNKAITGIANKTGNDSAKKFGSVAVGAQSAAIDIADPKGAAKAPAPAAKNAAAPAKKAPAPVQKVKAKAVEPKGTNKEM